MDAARDPSILKRKRLRQAAYAAVAGNLDSRNGEAVMELLSELHRTGSTICMVTHDARYASHARRTIHLFDGRVVEESLAT